MKRIGVFLFLILLTTGLAQATYTIKNYNITDRYIGGDIIKGYINISLNNQNVDTILKSNFEGNITLIDLIRRNSFGEGAHYSCSIRNCSNAYVSTEAIEVIDLDIGEQKLIGLKIIGEDVEVTDLKIRFIGDTGPSCSKQIDVDILGRNEYKLINDKTTNRTCNELHYGCFDSSLSSGDYQSAIITTEKYCNKINLTEAPGYWIGASLINSTTGKSNLSMSLYSSDWDLLGSCNLPYLNQTKGEIKCLIKYANFKENSFHVCISKTGTGTSNYKIRSEQAGKVCGFSSYGSDEMDWDYEITAQAAEFDNVDILMNETSFAKYSYGNSLIDYINTYLEEQYDIDCPSPRGCIIPIRLNSDVGQNVRFVDAEIKYQSGATFSSNLVYNVDEEMSTIDSGFLLLDISKAEFKIPINSIERKFDLFFDNEKEISYGINITRGFSFDLYPLNVTTGLSSTFYINTIINTTNINWDFGDGSTSEGNSKSVNHLYKTDGIYNVRIEITRTDGVKVVKTFSIISGDSRSAVTSLIRKYSDGIKNISSQIQNFDPFIKNEILNILNLTLYEDKLAAINVMVNSTNVNYSEILEDLFEIEVPKKIIDKKSGQLPLSLGFSNLNVEVLSSLDNSIEWNQKNSNLIRDRLVNWNSNNYDSIVNFRQVVLLTQNDEQEPLLSYFNINTNKITTSTYSGPLLLIINFDPEILKINGVYNSLNNGEFAATSIDMTSKNSAEFLMRGLVEVEELGAFLTPRDIKKELQIDENIDPPKPGKKPYWLFLILIVSFFVIYIILQEWYKRKYESHLFKNKDDLYNIINFIYNSRLMLMQDNQIKKKLSEMKWSGEQITYAFKKVDGKRTGMWEIPIFKIFEKKKVNNEIQRRNQRSNPQNVSFIKRPN